MSPDEVRELRAWVRTASVEADEPLCVCEDAGGGLAIRLDPIALMRRGRGMRADEVARLAPGTSLDEAMRVVAGLLAREVACST